jgi:hypothetical protein
MGADELDRGYTSIGEELPGTRPNVHVTPAVIVHCDSCVLARA